MSKEDVLRQLYQEILPLQGYKAPAPGQPIDLGLGTLQAAFPNGVFPTGAIHDFITIDDEQLAATTPRYKSRTNRLYFRSADPGRR